MPDTAAVRELIFKGSSESWEKFQACLAPLKKVLNFHASACLIEFAW
jgi:hypothetical protein